MAGKLVTDYPQFASFQSCMKIVHLLSQVELTGAEVYAIDLSDELIKLGHTCYIVSDNIHKRTKATFIPLTIHNATFFRRLRSIFFLRQFIISNKIGIVHAHSRAAVRIGFWATRFSKCALISTLHGKQHFSYSKKFFNIYGENIFSVCENIKLHFTKNFGFHDSQVQITRNFLNTASIDVIVSSIIKNEAGPSPTISFLGRTSGPKGLNWEHIINSYIEDWIHHFPSALFQFAGGEMSYFSEATQQKIKHLLSTYPDRFKFLGKMDHLFQVMNQSDIILGSGRIAIEGLYLKKIVLAIGEELYLGPITVDTFEQAIKSNFGDINSELKYHVNYEQLRNDVEAALAKLKENPAASNTAEILKQQTIKTFNKNFEVSQIIESYQWAQLKRRHPRNIPILMYHQIVDPGFSSPHKIYITESRFEEHLKYLKSSGFTAITFKELAQFRKDPETKIPSKPVIISFDDGYENNLKKALPLLQKYKMRAVFYLLAKPHDTNFWDANSGAPTMKLMTMDQRRQMSESMEIGSHGFNHEKLSTMDYEQASRELAESKAVLEQEFGTSINSYAYTYGDRSDRDILLAKQAGYDFAVNTTRGVLHFTDNPHNLFRISIFPTDTIQDLRRKTRSWYRLYYLKKRKE